MADTPVSHIAETAGLARGRCVPELEMQRVLPGSESENSAQRKRGDASRELSRLEALPEDLLIRVLCYVDRADLTPLTHVSCTIREAALMAKCLHFAYSTPAKSAPFRNSIDLDELFSTDQIEAPGAPKMKRRRLEPEKIAAVAAVLFPDDGEDGKLRRDGSKMEVDGST